MAAEFPPIATGYWANDRLIADAIIFENFSLHYSKLIYVSKKRIKECLKSYPLRRSTRLMNKQKAILSSPKVITKKKNKYIKLSSCAAGNSSDDDIIPILNFNALKHRRLTEIINARKKAKLLSPKEDVGVMKANKIEIQSDIYVNFETIPMCMDNSFLSEYEQVTPIKGTHCKKAESLRDHSMQQSFDLSNGIHHHQQVSHTNGIVRTGVFTLNYGNNYKAELNGSIFFNSEEDSFMFEQSFRSIPYDRNNNSLDEVKGVIDIKPPTISQAVLNVIPGSKVDNQLALISQAHSQLIPEPEQPGNGFVIYSVSNENTNDTANLLENKANLLENDVTMECDQLEGAAARDKPQTVEKYLALEWESTRRDVPQALEVYATLKGDQIGESIKRENPQEMEWDTIEESAATDKSQTVEKESALECDQLDKSQTVEKESVLECDQLEEFTGRDVPQACEMDATLKGDQLKESTEREKPQEMECEEFAATDKSQTGEKDSALKWDQLEESTGRDEPQALEVDLTLEWDQLEESAGRDEPQALEVDLTLECDQLEESTGRDEPQALEVDLTLECDQLEESAGRDEPQALEVDLTLEWDQLEESAGRDEPQALEVDLTLECEQLEESSARDIPQTEPINYTINVDDDEPLYVAGSSQEEDNTIDDDEIFEDAVPPRYPEVETDEGERLRLQQFEELYRRFLVTYNCQHNEDIFRYVFHYFNLGYFQQNPPESPYYNSMTGRTSSRQARDLYNFNDEVSPCDLPALTFLTHLQHPGSYIIEYENRLFYESDAVQFLNSIPYQLGLGSRYLSEVVDIQEIP